MDDTKGARVMAPSVALRQRVEVSVAQRFVLDALHAGHTLKVDNGEEPEDLDAMPQLTTCRSVMRAMFATDEEHVFVFKDGKEVGWVYFVYGNDGTDVISDYSGSLSNLGLIQGAERLASLYEFSPVDRAHGLRAIIKH